MASDANAVELVLRLVLSMGLIVAIILVAAKVMKGRTTLGFGLGRRGSGPRLDVLDRTQLSRHASVAVVRAGGRGLIVGITEQSVTLLAEAPELVVRYEQAEQGIADDAPEDIEAGRLGDGSGAERTGLRAERAAPGRTRMSFVEALRESTVRRS